MDASHTSSTRQNRRSVTITTVSRWAPKISVTNSVSDQMYVFSRTLWCHSEVDLWPFWVKKMSWLHNFIVLDICVKFCNKKRMNSWVMAKNIFHEVAVTFHHQILISSSLSPRVCAKFEEIQSRCSWDIVFTKMGRTGRQPKNIMRPALRHKNTSHSLVEHSSQVCPSITDLVISSSLCWNNRCTAGSVYMIPSLSFSIRLISG